MAESCNKLAEEEPDASLPLETCLNCCGRMSELGCIKIWKVLMVGIPSTSNVCMKVEVAVGSCTIFRTIRGGYAA